MRILLLTLLLSTIIYGAYSTPAFAVSIPTFPSCSNPQGSVMAQYDSGTHGIAGSTTDYTGKDSVYAQGNGNAMQCFCNTSGEGIQTNWVKISDISAEELASFQQQGWIYIPDGSLWGLDPAAYLAKNSNFSCNSGSSNGSSSSTSSNNSSGSSSPAQAVLAASTAAVAFANTGNMQLMWGVLELGIGTLLAALTLRWLSK